MNDLGKNATNENIVANIKDLNYPVVFAIETASNPNYKVLYLTQLDIDNLESNNLTKVQKILLGWRPGIKLLRCVQTIENTIFNSMNIEPGFIFEDFYINSQKSIEPAYYLQEPIKNLSGDVLLCNGKLVYEHTELVYGNKSKFNKSKEILEKTDLSCLFKDKEDKSMPLGVHTDANGDIQINQKIVKPDKEIITIDELEKICIPIPSKVKSKKQRESFSLLD